jgi:hypothetical protein
MRFLRTTRGGLVNADQIERIDEEREKYGLRHSLAILKEGGSVELTETLQDIEDGFRPVVAAAPGYVRIRYCEEWNEDGSAGVERLPIVAWRIDGGVAFPITPDDNEIDGLNAAVLMPDGQVVQSFMARFDNEAAWLAEMEREAVKRRQAEVKRKASEKEETNG